MGGGKEKGNRQMGFPIALLSHDQTLCLELRGSVGRGSGRGTCLPHWGLPRPLPPQSRP